MMLLLLFNLWLLKFYIVKLIYKQNSNMSKSYYCLTFQHTFWWLVLWQMSMPTIDHRVERPVTSSHEDVTSWRRKFTLRVDVDVIYGQFILQCQPKLLELKSIKTDNFKTPFLELIVLHGSYDRFQHVFACLTSDWKWEVDIWPVVWRQSLNYGHWTAIITHFLHTVRCERWSVLSLFIW